MNSVGVVHGGAIFALADFAFAMACNSGGKVARGGRHAPFLPAGNASRHAPRRGDRDCPQPEVSTCTVRVTDHVGELIALFQGTAYIKDEPFPPQAK